MSDYQFLLKFKNQSVNPECQTGVATAPVQNAQPKNVQMVSAGAIDVDMTDKIVKTSPAAKQAAQAPMTKEEESLLTSAWNCLTDCTNAVIDTVSECAGTVTDVVVEAYHDTMVCVQESTDFEWVHDHVATLDLNNENKAEAAKNSAKSKHKRCNERTGNYLVGIDDKDMQFGATSVCVKEGNEIARRSIAECTHCMHKENQAPVTGLVVEYSEEVETANIAIENISKCDIEVQAEAVACAAQGTVANKNFSREEKGQVGKNIAIEIPELDESAQAESFTSLAETMYDYEEVVTEVAHQVATNVTENVKNDTIKNLSNSQHQNLRETFTKENIERIATEYKKALGIEEKVSEEKIESIARDVKFGKVFNVQKAIEKAVVEETQVKENPFVTNTVAIKAQQTERVEKVAPVVSKAQTITEALDFIEIESTDGPRTQLLKQELRKCTSASQVAEILEALPSRVAKNMFKHISRTKAEALFKASKDSIDMQRFLLKNGFVKYENVKNHCIPGINKTLNVFANVDEYNELINENGADAVDEKQFKKDMAQAVLKI